MCLEKARKQTILNRVSDLVSNLLYYDRKFDEDLGPDEIEEALAAGEIKVRDIVDHFYLKLRHLYAYEEQAPKPDTFICKTCGCEFPGYHDCGGLC